MKRSHFILSAILLFVPSAVFAADTTRPTIGLVSPTDVTANTPVTLTASVSDADSGIKTCRLYVDSDDVGAMTVVGNTASIAYTFPAAQIYTVFAFCRDNADNINSGANASVWAHAPSGGGDTSSPVVGSISIASATVGVPVTVSVNVSDSGTGVSSCNLYAGGIDRGAMTLSGGTASKTYAFTTEGATTAYVQCKDGSNNIGTGGLATVMVAPAPQAPPSDQAPAPVLSTLKPSSLIKLSCPAAAAADHPCKAVYYFGTDGKRHAFPNERIYFTWYADFSGVTEVSADVMASAMLGKNVTYRPGMRMVKFTTGSKVYAVAHAGVLRWVKNESDAAAIFGADWNKKIDDLSDSFFSDYRYGADITPSARFSVTDELQNASTIDENFL